ncbi:DUF2937 family protein [Microvirga sp. 2MCAF38]|uniref:DUF2937 family protein n=1 Tax=Microvirga sp. 2MCAF38 TaxID=3232989 RepID=UPI003F958B00
MSRTLRIIAFGCGLIGAGIASQGPEFSQQYRQRLGGAVDELNRIIDHFDQNAASHGEARDQSIARLRNNPDKLVSEQGEAMQANVERLGNLDAQRRAMAQAGSFSRIFVMVREGDVDVMRAAYADFEPAVPITQEGVVSAASGFIIVWGGVLVLAGFVRGLFRSQSRTAAA